jgi:chromosome segregation ATPase
MSTGFGELGTMIGRTSSTSSAGQPPSSTPASQPTGGPQRDAINQLIDKLAKIGNKGEEMAAQAESLKGSAQNAQRILDDIETALNALIGLCGQHKARGGEVSGLLAQLQAADAEQQAIINRIQEQSQSADQSVVAIGQKASAIQQAIRAAQSELSSGNQAGGKRKTRRGGFVYKKAKHSRRTRREKQRGGFLYGKSLKRISHKGKKASRRGRK